MKRTLEYLLGIVGFAIYIDSTLGVGLTFSPFVGPNFGEINTRLWICLIAAFAILGILRLLVGFIGQMMPKKGEAR